MAPPAAPAEPRPKPTTRTTTPAPRTSSTTHRSTTTTRPTTSSAPRTSSLVHPPERGQVDDATRVLHDLGVRLVDDPWRDDHDGADHLHERRGCSGCDVRTPGDADTTDPADDPGALASEPVSSDGGTPTGALVALGLVLVVGGAGAVVARRRRSG
ncbi:hypothetical protein GCM10025868_42780 [Angustibacter aerolatus]|uniref:Gram-positive cocci surface proteins LPxTG domain-containing protein n=1 Tax=Angustibacter aerolatus TaxID=1162965 RepID=A0ABQ6JNS4_9ACTN|nr:hypothetical protein GCM10025868_42780 [Angustibacter aerolatus]